MSIQPEIISIGDAATDDFLLKAKLGEVGDEK